MQICTEKFCAVQILRDLADSCQLKGLLKDGCHNAMAHEEGGLAR